MATQRTKICFLHLPKTGGSSVHSYIMKNKPSGTNVCPERHNPEKLEVNDLEKYDIFSGHLNFAAVQKIPGKKFTLTTIREPKERVVSLYKFWRSHDLQYAIENRLHGPIAAKSQSFVDFLKTKDHVISGNFRNAAVRNFIEPSCLNADASFNIDDMAAVEMATNNLNTFDLIGDTLNLNNFFKKLALQLKVSPPSTMPRTNVTKFEGDNSEFETNEAIKLLNEVTEIDQIFYMHAKKIMSNKEDAYKVDIKKSWFQALMGR